MRKFLLAAVIALIVAVPVSTAVFANEFVSGEGSEEGRGRRHKLGPVVKLTSVSDDSVSFVGREGEAVTLSLAEDVKYLTISKEGREETDASAFSAGDWVLLKLGRGEIEGDAPIVKAIVLLPEAFVNNKEALREIRDAEKAGGEVTSISRSSITVTNRDGISSTFEITEATVLKSRDGIEVGDHVGIAYTDESGSKVALYIIEGKLCRPKGEGGPGSFGLKQSDG